MSPTDIALVLSLPLVLLAVVQRYKRSSNLPLPPGPPRLPILGNALVDLTSTPWKRYRDWSREYASDVVHLNMAGMSIVVLNTYEACVELFEKRSGIYSGRPPMPMLVDLMGWDWNFGLVPYGDRWRAHRIIAHQSLHEDATKSFRPFQLQMVQRMLKNFWEKPDSIDGNVRLMVSQIILSSIYGLDAHSAEDPFVQMAEGVVEALEQSTVPGKYLVDVFPILKHVPAWSPGASFQREAKAWRNHTELYLNTLLAEAEHRIDAGTAGHNFVAHHLGQIANEKGSAGATESREVVRNVAGVIYSAGSETTIASVMTFVHMMLLHPEVLRKAQTELDSVLPRGQLPSFDELDAGSLPYVTAVVLETIRWNTVTPLLVAHYTETEDEYHGYRIPANSTVFGNAWGILHDEKEYPEPDKFKPERFLKEDGTLNPDIKDPRLVAFGFGRRICPGRHFAYSTIWLSVASMLKVFDLSCEVDETGQSIEPKVEYKSSIVVYPEPFKCRINPRSSEKEAFSSVLSQEEAHEGY